MRQSIYQSTSSTCFRQRQGVLIHYDFEIFYLLLIFGGQPNLILVIAKRRILFGHLATPYQYGVFISKE